MGVPQVWGCWGGGLSRLTLPRAALPPEQRSPSAAAGHSPGCPRCARSPRRRDASPPAARGRRPAGPGLAPTRLQRERPPLSTSPSPGDLPRSGGDSQMGGQGLTRTLQLKRCKATPCGHSPRPPPSPPCSVPRTRAVHHTGSLDGPVGRLHRIHPLHPKIVSSDLDAGDRAVLDDLVAEEGQQSHGRGTGVVGQPSSPDIDPPKLGKVNPSSSLALAISLSQQLLLLALVITHPP